MPRFRVSADVQMEVQISIEAETAKQAEEIFNEQLAINVTLVDLDPESFDVEEDSVTDIDDIKVEKEST